MIVRPDEWITKPDENGDGLLKTWVVSGDVEFPIPIETHNVSLEDVVLGKDQDFEFVLECAEKPDIYHDEEAYIKASEHHSMASESVIPVGLYSPADDARILLNGIVVKTYEDSTKYGFDEDDVLFSISCLGNEYDAVLSAELAGEKEIREGNIVSCIYWVQGWPKENS